MNSQIKVRIVIVGKAAIKPPNLSLLFAISEINTTSPAVMAYFTSNHFMFFPCGVGQPTPHQFNYLPLKLAAMKFPGGVKNI